MELQIHILPQSAYINIDLCLYFGKSAFLTQFFLDCLLSLPKVKELYKQLKHLSKGSGFINVYIRSAKSIIDQLNVLQHPMSNKTLINDIHEGLGVEYHPLTRAIEATNTSITMMIICLLNEEAQL